MTRYKIILIIILGFLYGIFADAQNIYSLGSGLNRNVFKMFGDTLNSKLYAGGDFAIAGGIQSHCFAIWDGNAWDSTRNQFPSPPTDDIVAITKFQNQIYIGGSLGIFDTLGVQSGYGLARWDSINSVWDSFWVYGWVGALYSDNINLYIGGSFSNINNVQSHKIIRYDGTTFYGFPPLDTVMSGWAVNAIISYNNELYVGGNFYSQIASNMKDIAKWDGSQWLPVGNGLSGGFTWVLDFEIYQGILIVAGAFKVSSGDPGNNVVGWDGNQWIPLGNGVLNGMVRGMAVYNNELWVGGVFSYADGYNIPVSYLAKWDGAQWYNVGLVPNASIYDLTVLGNDLYISGGFKIMNGDTVNHIIKYNNLTGFDSEVEEFQSFILYPNPASDMLYGALDVPIGIKASLKICDLTGRVLNEIPLVKNSSTFDLDVSSLNNGIYQVVLESKGMNRLVKQMVVIR